MNMEAAANSNTTALATVTPGEAIVWTPERIELVRRTICPPTTSDDEFAIFLEQCRRSGLDPLQKQAFCVPRRQNLGSREAPRWVTKHEFQPSEVGMLARAERFPDFLGVQASAVFAGDEIVMDQGAGTVVHRFNPVKRTGGIVGAWARLVRREGRLPVLVWLAFDGYAQSTPLWSKIPTTMIEKCARVAVLRKAYPEAFGGLYIREEMPAEEFDTEAPPQPQQQRQAPRRGPVVEAEVVQEGERRAHRQEAAKRSTQALPPDTATATVLAFGPHKGRAMAELTDGQLGEAMRLAREKLEEQPRASWARTMRTNLGALEAEVDRRRGVAPREPGVEG